MTFAYNIYKFDLASGRRVYYNRIQGYGVEHDGQQLLEPTKAEALEIAQKVSDSDGLFSEECKADMVAHTDKW